MRPGRIEEYVGQEHLLGKNKLLRRMMEGAELYSIILWGPPGTGKTTLAHIIANASQSLFMPLSAVTSSIREVREIVSQAILNKKAHGRRTILFVDEIHRFNKAQQDAFLPHVERGDIVFFGATTENPSFEVISPLLSRTKVLVLKPLTDANLKTIVQRALADEERGLGQLRAHASGEVLEYIIAFSQGDARVALNTLEIAAGIAHPDAQGLRELTRDIVEEALQKKMLIYDKAGEEHYNIISALHKSMRNSDADASLYWLARMLEAGEDPLYIARRLVRFASEDIGNADPKALQIALEAKEAFHFIGLPEGKLALAQATIYMATAPKSNALYTAYSRAAKAVEQAGALPVPLHIRNAPTALMKSLEYGKGYKYAHDYADGITDMDCLPKELQGRKFYYPSDRGYEKIIKERIEYIQKKKKESRKQT
ncbi:MAG: replication-associated recombination protein A [Deltaproteobacteria bacterium]|nr:replication-associated recombination protein A [Deltaproteobacteria bacterium]